MRTVLLLHLKISLLTLELFLRHLQFDLLGLRSDDIRRAGMGGVAFALPHPKNKDAHGN